MGSSTKSLETRDEVAHRHPAQWSDTAGEIAFAAMRPTSDTNGSVQEPPLQDETITRIADELPVFPDGVYVPEHDRVRFAGMVIDNQEAGGLSSYQRKGVAESVRSIAEEYEEAYFQNTNPEVLSKLEDLRIVTAEAFFRLNKLGLLPVEIDLKKVQEILEVPIFKYSPSEQSSADVQGSLAFSTTESPHSLIGTRKDFSVMIKQPVIFTHEMTHSVLQDSSDEFSPSLMEATVQHIADRGLQIVLGKDGEVVGPDSIEPTDARRSFNRTDFTESDTIEVYEDERRVMYQLAPVEDFVAALCDASKIPHLKAKINASGVGKKLGLSEGEDLMTALQAMIDGDTKIPGFDTPAKRVPSWLRAQAVNCLLLQVRGKKRDAKVERGNLKRELAAIPEARVT